MSWTSPLPIDFIEAAGFSMLRRHKFCFVFAHASLPSLPFAFLQWIELIFSACHSTFAVPAYACHPCCLKINTRSTPNFISVFFPLIYRLVFLGCYVLYWWWIYAIARSQCLSWDVPVLQVLVERIWEMEISRYMFVKKNGMRIDGTEALS